MLICKVERKLEKRASGEREKFARSSSSMILGHLLLSPSHLVRLGSPNREWRVPEFSMVSFVSSLVPVILSSLTLDACRNGFRRRVPSQVFQLVGFPRCGCWKSHSYSARTKPESQYSLAVDVRVGRSEEKETCQAPQRCSSELSFFSQFQTFRHSTRRYSSTESSLSREGICRAMYSRRR